MDSSDDSFAWTTASSANEESELESNQENMTERHIESESEKSYKKKLHKKLFKSECEVKHELLNGDTVKHEADSDVSASATPKKRKRKRERSLSSNAESKLTNEYLDMRVKQEHNITCTSSLDEKPKSAKVKHTEDPDENSDMSQNIELDSSNPINKKKKSKRKKKRQDVENAMIFEDKFNAEETIIETRLESKPSSMDVDVEGEGPIEKKKEKKKKKKRNHDTAHNLQHAGFDLELTSQTDSLMDGNEEIALQNSKNIFDKSADTENFVQGTSKISDRIQFEDEEGLIVAGSEPNKNSVSIQSSKLRRFLKANPHLHLLQCNSDLDSCISQDDDIWLFHCPSEINILSLKDCDLSLDNKCKIKCNSQTFVGNMENEITGAAFLTFEKNAPVIKYFELCGTVNFRKRIPKPHYLEDNIISNNQTEFIPLPDIKCRHPLFGPDYKKAIKIPSTIKSRLQNSFSESSKKGKKKKKKKYEENDETDIGAGGNVETGETDKARKRHRSHCELDQPVRKKMKHMKHELESAKTWDSEKAIEENLFNF